MPRTYSPTDLNSPLIARLGQPVTYLDGDSNPSTGILANIHVDGTATIVDYTDTVTAVVPVGSIVPHAASDRPSA